MKATIFDIQRNSFVDGPGIRTTVFFKGCNLNCLWCHNPESKSFATEMLFYKDKCVGCGKCKEVCPNNFESCSFCGRCELFCPQDARKVCGKEYTVDEVFEEIVKDQAFYENSGGGVTFSGGECMLQIEFLEEILKKCKEKGIHTTVDTAGFVDFSRFERILPYTDLFLYDIKCFNKEKHREYVGVENDLILENLKKLLNSKADIWIRIPVIPTVNDTVEEMQKIKEFLSKNGKPQKIELLPYHAMGENKYNALGLELKKFTVPSNEKMKELNSLFNN